MIILGIETSCDETALALIETREANGRKECRVIHSLVHSQAELHSAYGGVYPSLAKREHGKNLIPLLHKLLIESGEALKSIGVQSVKTPLITQTLDTFRTEIAPQNPELFISFEAAEFLKKSVPPIDQIAVTEGPGLEPALWVGINCARMLGELWDVPVTAINHMEGHVVASLLPSDIPFGSWQELTALKFPALALLISGGHTELVEVKALGDYSIIGATKDDAVGEVYDKAARLLSLPYPGGPHMAKLAHEAREANIPAPLSLPRPMIGSGDINFSFSGLKTAVLYAVRSAEQAGTFNDNFKKGLAREFEDAVAEVLDTKVRAALEQTGAQTLIVGGGVSANSFIRERLEKIGTEYSIPILFPSRHLSGDNALMIALAATLNPQTKTPGMIRAHGTKRLGS